MLDINFENVRLWVNAHQRPDGSKWNTYAVSTSSKNEAGDYVNKSLKVKMTKNVQIPEDIVNGELVTIRGFLSNETYMDKNGERRVEHIAVAQEVDFMNRLGARDPEPADSFDALEEDMPF